MSSKLEKIYYKIKNEPGYLDNLVDKYIKYLDDKYDIHEDETDIKFTYTNKNKKISVFNDNKIEKDILNASYQIMMKHKDLSGINHCNINSFNIEKFNYKGFNYGN